MKRNYEEGSHQAALFEWAALKTVPEGGTLKDYMFSIPNGAKRNVIQAAILKRQGLKAGVPDVCISIPRKSYHGMFLELKRKCNYRLTPEQRTLIDRLNSVGYCARVSNNIDKSIEMIEEYLK